MKLNSKLPILVIITTLLTFTYIWSNNTEQIEISTIKGNQEELDNVKIKLEDLQNNRYFTYKYTISKDGVAKETKLTKEYNDIHEMHIETICDKDYINYIGYRVESSYIADYIGIDKDEERSLVIYEREQNKKNEILKTQGKDTRVYLDDMNTKNLKETIIKIDDSIIPKNYNPCIYSTNRYKGKVYMGSVLHNVNITEGDKVQIGVLDKTKNTLKKVRNIEVAREIGSNNFSVAKTYNYKDKMYFLLDIYNNSDSKELYLLTYEIEKDEYTVDKINKEDSWSFLGAIFKDGKIEIAYEEVLSNTKVIYMDYDIETKKINNKNLVEIPRSDKKINSISFNDFSIINEEKIYCMNVDQEGSYINQKYNIYVIDKNKKEVVYKGYIRVKNIVNSMEFTDK